MRFSFIGIFLCLILLPSCAIKQPLPSQLPAEISMNGDVTRIGQLIVTVQLEDGEKAAFVLGSQELISSLDKSLALKLGSKRLTTSCIETPKFFLGKAQLMKTGGYVYETDYRPLSLKLGRPVMGTIGMDVLQHYCIQLDFAAKKIRFLDDRNSNKGTWGKPFHLSYYWGVPEVSGNLAGASYPGSLIDLGWVCDGGLVPDLYQQWSSRLVKPDNGLAQYPNVSLHGEIYTNVVNLSEGSENAPDDWWFEYNVIGLSFLSRNLVTLDFPKKTMYLKPTGANPLGDNGVRLPSKSELASARAFLIGLKQKGHLPGWSQHDIAPLNPEPDNFVLHNTIIVDDVSKKGDPYRYNYVVSFSTNDTAWTLEEAWQTDPYGNLTQKYPIK